MKNIFHVQHAAEEPLESTCSRFSRIHVFIFSFVFSPWICSWISCHVSGFSVWKMWLMCFLSAHLKKNSSGRIINGAFMGCRIGNEVVQIGGEVGPF